MRKAVFIFVLSLLVFVFSAKPVLAVDVVLSGKIVDQENNPIPQSTVVVNDQSGKTIVAATSDPSGFYSLSIPSGTYTISVSPPSGMKAESVSYPDKTLVDSSVMNFSLKTSAVVEAKKSFISQNLLIGIAIFLCIFFAGFIYWKKNRFTAV